MIHSKTHTLHLTDDGIMQIWLSFSNGENCEINVSDLVSHITYHVAEFNGSKYNIKNMQYFNDVFIKCAKKRPQIVRDLLKEFQIRQFDPDDACTK